MQFLLYNGSVMLFVLQTFFFINFKHMYSKYKENRKYNYKISCKIKMVLEGDFVNPNDYAIELNGRRLCPSASFQSKLFCIGPCVHYQPIEHIL